MSREIKFRGKRVDNGEWVEGDLVRSDNQSFIVFDKDSFEQTTCGIDYLMHDRYFEVIPETVGQYTGLKDKNDKDICEGDVVEISAEEYPAVIEWDDETCRFVINIWSENVLCDFDNYHGKELEIIGNKFDNPELLGEIEVAGDEV